MDADLKHFKSLKKANCHLHITGALSPRDLRRIAKIAEVDISPFEPLEKHMDFYDPAIWAAAKEVTSTRLGLLEGIKTILAHEADDGVIYLEVTVNAAGMVRRGMSPRAIADSISEAFAYGNTLGIAGKAKFGVNRKDGPASAAAVKDAFDATPEDARISIDLNGDERAFPTSSFTDEFSRLIAAGAPTSIHAGEYPELSSSLKQAIALHPARIAHAVAADADAVRAFADNGIVLESSPISNLKTRALIDPARHPLKQFVAQGVPVLFGSDNPGIFQTTMSAELAYLAAMGIDRDMVDELNRRALALVGASTN